jgi:hypothetical protein
MSIRRCDFCDVALVEWMTTWKGGRLPFELDLVAPGRLPGGVNGWIPGRWKVDKRSMIAMAPATQYPTNVQSAATRVAVVHECPQFLAHRARRVLRSARQRGTELIAA